MTLNHLAVGSYRQILVLFLFSLLLSGCSGGDSSSDSATGKSESRSTEESSARSNSTQDEADSDTATKEPDSDSASGSADVVGYYRAAEYPNAVDLPLQYIPTVGGKQLSVRVTLPADENGKPLEGPFPVIVTQSAYNTNLLAFMFMGTPGNLLLGVSDSFIVKRGYAQVAVDALGTGASEGAWELLGELEQIGFADAVEWADRQPWSNGQLGVAGISYMAISSLFAAQRRPDLVDAVFASLPMGDAMRGIVGVGGMLNAVFMSTWMSITHNTSTQNVQTAFLNPSLAGIITSATQDHVEQLDRFHLPMIENALNGDPTYNYDGEFWRIRSPIENIDKVEAPTFFFSALHDIFQRDTPLMYEALKAKGLDTRLVVYDGTHFVNFVKSHVGNEEVPPVDYMLLQWFDKHLKGMDTDTESIPPVVQFVKNYPTPSTPEEFQNDSYASTTDWPHPLAEVDRWYLRGDSSLSLEPPLEEEATHEMVNPENPTGRAYKTKAYLNFEVNITDGSRCSKSYNQWTLGLTLPKSCSWDSNDSSQQRLVFDSQPMEEDYYINGPIQADIWIDSTVTEAVVAVQIEVLTDQQSQPLTNGQLLASGRAVNESRARFLNGEMIQPYHYFTLERSQPLVPGEIVKLPIEIFPTSAVVPKGARLRVSVSPSNQAQAMLNYARQEMADGGITTIHNSPEYPSSVVLPVVPVSALN